MRRFSTIIVIALSTLLLVSSCSAQQDSTTAVPYLIRHSGTLKDAQGAVPFSQKVGGVGVTFAIYKQEDGGAPVWSEIQNVTTDENGQYNVVLGSTASTGVPDNLFSQAEQRWLGVQVQGQPEQKRALLVSVPYAFKAHEAETLGGLPASAFLRAASADASSTTPSSPVGPFRNAGDLSPAKSATPKSVQGPCNPVPGYITYWDATGALCASKLFQDLTTGNVGIGSFTTPPSEALDVKGNISTYNVYDINEQRILGVSTSSTLPAPTTSTNLFVGWFAGGTQSLTPNNGSYNTFTGYLAGASNNASSAANGSGNTYNGFGTGLFNVIGTDNVMLGRAAGSANTGSFNTCVGSLACDQIVSGGGGFNTNGNAIFGYKAGNQNAPADPVGNTGNSFFGFQSGLSNVTGYHNTFMGYNAGMSNSTADDQSFGRDNTFVGFQSGMSSKTSQGNTFVGTHSGMLSGGIKLNDCCNTFVGNGSGAVATSTNNTFLGYGSGQATTIGNDNTFIGLRSGSRNTEGIENAFLGTISGEFNTIGSRNTFLGRIAGHSNASGDSNTYLGFNSGISVASDGSSNILIGSQGVNTDNNTIRIGSKGTSTLLHNRVFMDPILLHPGASADYLVSIDTSGQLGFAKSTGGITTSGGCPTSPANFITRWTGANIIDCSHIYEDPITFFVGINNGPKANEALDVNGATTSGINTTNTRKSYMIGRSAVLTAFGDRNTFVGFTGAHTKNTAAQNTFVGDSAGDANTSGGLNSFFGSAAGASNNTGEANTCIGQQACRNMVSSSGNTAVGFFSGTTHKTGNRNIFLGYNAGSLNTNGNGNIYLGNDGIDESNTIRIGTNGTLIGQQNKIFITPILSNPSTNNQANVFIDTFNGQLGYLGSSRRFKDQILDMGDTSSKLLELRPVRFFYKPQYDDGSHLPQYGLIAEEVANVYPEMVAYDKDGLPATVKYQLLAPMLLNELQKQHTVVTTQQDAIKTQQEQIQTQAQQIQDLQQRLLRMESLLENK
jgi:hypothetical protein